MSLTVTGIQQAEALIGKVIAKLNNIEPIMQQVGQEIVSAMQGKAPVDTGFLRDSIELTEVSNTQMTITSGAPYSLFVEFGTYKMAAQPYFFGTAHQFLPAQLQQRIIQNLLI